MAREDLEFLLDQWRSKKLSAGAVVQLIAVELQRSAEAEMAS